MAKKNSVVILRVSEYEKKRMEFRAKQNGLTVSEYLRQFLEGEIAFDAKEIRRTVVEKFGKGTFKKNMSQCFDSVINQEK